MYQKKKKYLSSRTEQKMKINTMRAKVSTENSFSFFFQLFFIWVTTRKIKENKKAHTKEKNKSEESETTRPLMCAHKIFWIIFDCLKHILWFCFGSLLASSSFTSLHHRNNKKKFFLLLIIIILFFSIFLMKFPSQL